jgi:hypothetical protein
MVRAQQAKGPLEFDTVEQGPAWPVGRVLKITGVERDGRGIDMTYEVRPPLSSLTDPPRAEARDDRGTHYRALARAIRLAGSQRRTTTVGSFPWLLPKPCASLLRVRMTWSQDLTSLWQLSAHEVRIRLSPATRRRLYESDRRPRAPAASRSTQQTSASPSHTFTKPVYAKRASARVLYASLSLI